MNYRAFFGLTRDPFAADLALDAILKTKDLTAVHERIGYTVGLGAIALVTGEVGAGKSTALRWVAGQFHPSKYKILWVSGCRSRGRRRPASPSVPGWGLSKLPKGGFDGLDSPPVDQRHQLAPAAFQKLHVDCRAMLTLRGDPDDHMDAVTGEAGVLLAEASRGTMTLPLQAALLIQRNRPGHPLERFFCIITIGPVTVNRLAKPPCPAYHPPVCGFFHVLGEQEDKMQIFTMIWSGINGHGAGTIFLKGLFIIALAGIFWITCELAKHLVNVFAKLIVDGLRYLAIMTRGWPKQDEEKKNDSGVLLYRNRAEKQGEE